jgi:hypothetical protein
MIKPDFIDIDDLTVTREQGGMREFEKTGIYPNYIVFNSYKLKKSWRQKVTKENQKGYVRSNGNIIFNYELSDNGCSVQFIRENIPNPKWIHFDVITMMVD